jgi:DNA-binding NtrC family response regulator
VHLDLDGAVARTCFAATAGHIEAEPPGRVAAELGFGRLSEQLAHVVEYDHVVEQPEREIILEMLRSSNWNRNVTADRLGINRTTLYKKMKRLGLEDPRIVPQEE